MKKILIVVLVVLFIVQWIVPGKMIWEKENILSRGKEFRFRTEPIDPSNPFTGKYIWLNFKEHEFDLPAKKELRYDQDIFVLLKNDDSGYAKIENIVFEEPKGNMDFVKAKLRSYSPIFGLVGHRRDSIESQNIQIEYPFERFYMDEFKAPKAEKMYRQSNRDGTQKVYAIVAVSKGKAVIKDVMINEKPIRMAIEGSTK